MLDALVEGIGRFVRERLIPNENIVAESDAIPEQLVAEMKALGLFGLSIPEAYGGLGLTMKARARSSNWSSRATQAKA